MKRTIFLMVALLLTVVTSAYVDANNIWPRDQYSGPGGGNYTGPDGGMYK